MVGHVFETDHNIKYVSLQWGIVCQVSSWNLPSTEEWHDMSSVPTPPWTSSLLGWGCSWGGTPLPGCLSLYTCAFCTCGWWWCSSHTPQRSMGQTTITPWAPCPSNSNFLPLCAQDSPSTTAHSALTFYFSIHSSSTYTHHHGNVRSVTCAYCCINWLLFLSLLR